MLVCEYIDMYDRERMGDVLLPCECIYQKPYHHFYFHKTLYPQKTNKIQKYHVTWM